MPVEKISEGQWRVRLRYGAGLRGRFILVAKSESAAEVKAARMQKMAETLSECGKHAEAKAVLDEAGAARTDRELAEVEQVVRELCAETPQKPSASRGSRTPFKVVAEMWLSGELHTLFPRRVRKKKESSVAMDRARVAAITRQIGDMPIGSITLELAERALDAATPPESAQATARQYAQALARILSLAVYPLQLIERSPLPPDFVPPQGKSPAFSFLYPDEEAQLMVCRRVPLSDRIVYGVLAREGLRVSEAMSLTWGDIDLVRGVLTLDKNKTDTPRAWTLGADVVASLAAYRGGATDYDVVFPEFIIAGAARTFREHLLTAGVARKELHARSTERRPMRVHDLRGTFVTLALATGRSERWVMDRTGHTTSTMLSVYARPSRFAQELSLGWLQPLDQLLDITKGLGQGLGHGLPMTAKTALEHRTSSSAPDPLRNTSEPNQAVSESGQVDADPRGPAGFPRVGQESPVEIALSAALTAAIANSQWDLAQTIVQEIGERRRARVSPQVASLEAARKRRDEGGGK